MNPGRTMDKLVAEKIFGHKVVVHNSIGRSDYFYEEFGALVLVPRYSEHIASAWDVVEKLNELGFLVSVSSGNKYYAKLDGKVAVQIKLETENLHEQCIGQSAPHAICLAALAALNPTSKAQPGL